MILLSALVPYVFDVMPVQSGETFESYVDRARETLKPSQRASIAAHISRLYRFAADERTVRKRVWIGNARLDFDPGPRHRCVICNQYFGLTQAHHIVPLSLQFDLHLAQPDQAFDWLCPTHHVAAHVAIAGLLRNEQLAVMGMPSDESDALAVYLVGFVERYRSMREAPI